MNKNELYKLNLKKLTDLEKIEKAELFSEGNELLKNLLLKMWDRGIETYACCSGHEGKSDPYIFFSINNFLNSNFNLFALKVIRFCKKNNYDLSFSNDFLYDLRYDRKGLGICAFNDRNVSTKFFTNLEELLFGENFTQDYKFSKKEAEIVDSLVRLYQIDMSKYIKNSKKSSNCQTNSISIIINGKEVIIRSYNNMKHKSFKFSDKQGKEKRYLLAEGFYRTIFGKYYTLINNETKELNNCELKNYKPYRIYKKYNRGKFFTVENFNETLKIFK